MYFKPVMIPIVKPIVLVSLLASASASQAAIFNIADGDVAALIEAIQASNGNGEADIINLAAAGDYVLSANQNPGSASGLPRIEGELVINGNGATLRRSGAKGVPSMRILLIHTTATVEINEVTIRDGFTTGFGSGINNTGTLVLNDCTVTANTGNQGGGIFNSGLVEINRCEISDNTAPGGNGGGGIYSQGAGADVTLVESVISGNSAVGAGGGIRNLTSGAGAGGVFTIIDSVIEHNSAMGINGHGGGIDDSGRMTIAGSIIRHNSTSGDGGGIRSSNGSERFLTISDSAFHNNTAGANGGGLRLSFSDINLSGLEVHENTAENGAGIYSATTSSDHLVTISDCTIRDNEAAVDGGGIFNSRSTMSLLLCRVVENTAGGLGGGILNRNVTTLTLTGSTVDANTAGLDGGGVWNGTLLVLDRSTLSNNVSEAGNGGGIMNDAVGARVNALNTTISGNIAGGTGSTGGGLHNTRFGSDVVRMSLVTVTGNQATSAGGIFNDPDAAFQRSVELDNSIVAGNIGGDINTFYDDLGHNIIGDGSGVTEPTSFMADPQLGPLEDNGGPTLTHALSYTSPAIGAGDCLAGTVNIDQRGIQRPQNAGCDIGAFELEDDTLFADRFETLGAH